MKLPKSSVYRSRSRMGVSGQILAEACIGIALLTMVWILLSFSSYMANNRIRTVMAARDAAWLQANGGDPGALIPSQFFYKNDQNIAQALPGEELTLSPLGSESSGDSYGWSAINATAWSNRVTFGVSDVLSTEQYPFVLMKTHLPYMPDSLLSGFLSVSSSCAWPADLDQTWNSWSDVLGAIGVPYVH